MVKLKCMLKRVVFFYLVDNQHMTDFEHCLTPEEFTTLLNLLPILSRRGAFSIKEYNDITPLYEKMSATAKSFPDLFAFDEGAEVEGEGEEGRGGQDEEDKSEEETDEDTGEREDVEDDDDRVGEERVADQPDDGGGERQQEQEESEGDTNITTTDVQHELAVVKAELMQLRAALGK